MNFNHLAFPAYTQGYAQPTQPLDLFSDPLLEAFADLETASSEELSVRG